MKVQTCFVFASMLAGALAAPLRQRDTVVHTEYVNVVEVVSMTSTVWVNPGETPVAKNDNVKSSAPAPAVATSTVVRQPTYTPSPSPKKSDPQTTTSRAPQPTPEPKQEPTPTPKVEKPTSTSTQAPAQTSKASNSHSGTGGSKSGEGTYYATGMGSCGIESSPDQDVVAISHVLMDAATVGGNTNGNPLCGKKITCHRGGKSVEVTVVDRCQGCKENDLDFSESAFKKLASTAEGRVDIEWNWSS